jgi:hypothetical protein
MSSYAQDLGDKYALVADLKERLFAAVEGVLNAQPLERGNVEVTGVLMRDIEVTLRVGGVKTQVILDGKGFTKHEDA